jgi:hypothetical protein
MGNEGERRVNRSQRTPVSIAEQAGITKAHAEHYANR